MSRLTSLALSAAALVPLLLAACSDQPTAPPAGSAPTARADAASDGDVVTAAMVRQLAAARGIVPFARPRPVRPALVRLGQALLFDRILSGNRDIACATCHLPALGTGDGRSLSIGQGAAGMGPDRTHPSNAFIARNAPPLFNLGTMRHLFWDGRIAVEANGHVVTPAGKKVPAEMQRVFEFGAISALAMFPVTNRAEMRADGSGDLAKVPDDQPQRIWDGLMRRLGEIPEYRAMFEAAYPGTPFESMTFAHASNAIGGFIVDKLTFTNSPWDRFMAGRDDALSPRQLAGAQAFLTLKCSICHNGSTFSDDQFHDVAVAQVGPGLGDGPTGHDDFGRMRVTGLPADRYRFRTSPLRNVELTAPYGHDGSIASLRDFVEHYSESDRKLLDFDPNGLEPLLRATFLDNRADVLAQRDPLLEGVVLTPDLVDKLTDYMKALTDDAARDLTPLTPASVPSGLRVDRPVVVAGVR